MPDFPQYSFTAGEFSPEITGRGDLERYAMGVAFAENFFLDYRGGLANRPGTRFAEYIQHDDKHVRLWDFVFSQDDEETYVLLFGDGYIRFIQNGAYLLEAAKTITGVSRTDPGVVTTSGAHGYANGDYVKVFSPTSMTELHQFTFTVANATATTFELQDQFGNNVDTSDYSTYTTGGTVQRVYTVAHGYDEADLHELYFWQNRDVLRITHVDYPPAELIRLGATNWTLSDVVFGSAVDAPTGLTLTPSSSGAAGVGFQVTAVSQTGEESIPSRMVIEEASVNYTTTAGSITLEWTQVEGAQYYNVYRTLVQPTGANVTYSDEAGFVGKALGPRFVDNNITPDFVVTPPLGRNPFANNAVSFITMTAGGSGYAKGDSVSVSGGSGSGFVGYPIVSGGVIVGVVVVNGGENYTSPVVSFGTGTGSGATATATLTPSSGNYPAISTIFQQRYIYAGTLNNPMNVYGSKAVASFSNFDVSFETTAGDAYTFELDSQEVSPIRWAIAGLGGMIIGTKTDVWLMRGAEDQNVNALSVQADPLGSTSSGASRLPPLAVDNTIVYTQKLGGGVKALVYNYTLRNYRPRDLAVQSTHLIGPGKRIDHWGYLAEPHYLAWAVREDGVALTLTYLPDENIDGLTHHVTQGLYKDVVVVTENEQNIPYFVVRRYINGRWQQLVEQGVPREVDYVEDFWGVDCGLELPEETPAADLVFVGYTGSDVSVQASAGVFTSGDVGRVIRGAGGRATITLYRSATEVWVTFTRDITAHINGIVPEVPAGQWTISTPVSTVSGLDHLEGMEVVGLADGNYVGPYTVVNGAVELDEAYSRIKIGLQYVSIVRTLPTQIVEAIIQAKLKRTSQVAVRIAWTHGIEAGTSLDHMYEIPLRLTDENWGMETLPKSGLYTAYVSAQYDYDDQIYIRQRYPLPAYIAGLFAMKELEDAG